MRLVHPLRILTLVTAAALVASSCSSHSDKKTAFVPPSSPSVGSSVPLAGSSTSAPVASSLSSPATALSASATKSAGTSASAKVSSQAPTRPPAPAAGLTGPCGIGGAAHYSHVVWIWMENKEYGSVIGSPSAPYENTLAKECGLAGNYHGVTHPSLPNYIAATGGSTFGIADDAAPPAHPIAADSIFGQLLRSGLTWRAYEESMPRNCDLAPASPYAVKHNPAAYFTAIRAACAADDVPLGGNLDHDIAAGTLPSFSFVTPNLCNDTHDCSVRTGDNWLATWIPKILSGSNYRAGNTLVVLTWDEGVGSVNQIPTIVIGPTVPAGVVPGQRFDHYSLLRTTEDLLGLPHLANAASAASMAAAFGV